MAKNTSKTQVAQAVQPIPASSMDYRPRDYFGRHDLQTELLTHVKGSFRRKALRDALGDGTIDEVPPGIVQSALSEPVRQFAGSLHPSLMSGEYLPSMKGQELEIARIRLQSTTGDVTCVYARQVGQRIAYRVVDEYGGETLSGKACRSSCKPLSMGQLIELFLGAWNLYGCLDCNFDTDLAGMMNFFDGESEYYPYFDTALRDLVRQWFRTAHEANPEEEAEDEQD